MIHRLKYLAAACLLAGCFVPLVAQDALTGDFTKPAEIEKRLTAARADLQNLPADADPALRERIQQLEAACQYHLAAVRIAATAQARVIRNRVGFLSLTLCRSGPFLCFGTLKGFAPLVGFEDQFCDHQA